MVYVQSYESGSKNDKLSTFLLATLPGVAEATSDTKLQQGDLLVVSGLGKLCPSKAEAQHVYIHDNVNPENSLIRNDDPTRRIYYIGVKRDSEIPEIATFVSDSLRSICPELQERSIEVTSERIQVPTLA